MMEHRLDILVILTAFFLRNVSASHFRGAIITWKPGASQNEVIIDYRISWRMTYSDSFTCNDNTIQTGETIGGEGTIDCFDNCAGSLGSLRYQCTDYSTNEDWSSGKGRITATLTSSYSPYTYYNYYRSSVFHFGFAGQAWINTLVVGSGGSWQLKTTADLTYRSDIGRINSSPRAEVSPIVRLQRGCNHTVIIPVNDPDSDVVKCRWADYRQQECGSVCGSPPNANMNYDTCTITYEAVRTGWYAVPIQVEDYADADLTTPLSSIPVQFLFNVYEGGKSCEKTTAFVYPTPPENACIGVPFNQVLHTAIVARVADPDRRISEIKTISPLGMTKSHLYNVSAKDWRMNVTWSPENRDVSNIFCFSAVESLMGTESNQRCVTLLAGVASPALQKDSQVPANKVYPSRRQWSISADINIMRATRPTYIRLYNRSGHQQEQIDASDSYSVTIDSNKNQISFTSSTTLIEKETYYFLFDFGIVRGTTYCKAESMAINDISFWKFRIRDITPPTITLVEEATKTNATAEIKWTVNEPATAVCTLTNPSGKSETTSCKNTWSKSDLQEGRYTLNIVATDLEGNSARESHTWVVDTTPPVVTMLEKPKAYSNQQSVIFRWQCPFPCTTFCSVSALSRTYSVSCSNLQLLWSLPATNSNIKYNLDIKASDDVGNVNETSYTWTTDFESPTIHLCGKGQSFTIDCAAGDFKPETICNVSVSDNIDISPNISYRDTSMASCGFDRKWTAVDKAGNVATEDQQIHINSKRNIEILRYPGPLLVACGALDNMTDVLISMFEIHHPCDMKVKFSYADNPSYQICDTTVNRTWTISDDCGHNITVYQPLRILQAKKPLSPNDGQTGMDLNIFLRWQGSMSSKKYEIYLWKRGTQRPKKASYVSFNSYLSITSLSPGTKYNWQVVFLYNNNETYFSPIWVFETRFYVDLSVTDITVPPSAFTGERREIKWTVINRGRIALQYSYWTDGVYLSWDDNFRNSKLVARVTQQNILNPADGYSSSASFTFDERLTGNAYIFVYTDIGGYIVEHNTTNNVMRSSSSIEVKLTPPPDLEVTSIRYPGPRVYSGSNVQLTWTVVNAGEGPIKDTSWWDRVWWSQSQDLGFGAKYFSTTRHDGNIAQNGNYTQSISIKIPEFISGEFYVIIETDVYNHVFENFGENNNLLAKKVQVLLTPPPDLEVQSILVSESWVTGNTVTISWTVQNSGNDSPLSQMYWQDRVKLVSRTGNWWRVIGVVSHYGTVRSDATYTSSLRFYVSPDISTGDYNVIVVTDFTDRVFEYTHNNNNQNSRSISVRQALPDLKIENFTVSLNYDSNSTVLAAEWKVQNIGNGKTLSNRWIDTLQVKPESDFMFSALKQNYIEKVNGLQPLENYRQNVSVVLPFSIYGNVAFRLVVDNIYKSTGDPSTTNNIYTLSDVEVKLRAADLAPSDNIQINEYILAGKPILVNYRVFNKGNRQTENVTWADRIFISDSIGEEMAFNGLDKLRYVQSSVGVNKSYSESVLFTIPKDMSGSFFVIVEVDIYNNIFEGLNTLNNKVGKLINVEPSPAADLSVMTFVGNLTSFINNERIVSLNWKVTNLGNSMSNFLSWQDRISYTRNAESRNLITLNTFTIEHFLESQASYEQNKKLVLPSNLFGKLYLCLEVDVYQDVYESHSRGNNIRCQITPIEIKTLLPARLTAQIISIASKNESRFVPGSNLEVYVTVTNVGDKTTSKSSWIDSIYLTNQKLTSEVDLKNTGQHLQDVMHIGNLQPKQSYGFVTRISIPSRFSGKPFIIVLPDNERFDETDQTISNTKPSEKNATDTNATNASVSVFGSFQLPNNIALLFPNLEVESDKVFGTLIGGQPAVLDYNITNTGNVSTYSAWYDSVYLSEDFVVDAFDMKLKSIFRDFLLEPDETVSLNMTFFLPKDLETKSYYLAIVCDSRDDLYEENENDNVKRIVFDLTESVSTDIVVKQVKSPSFVEYGNEITVTWDLINNGTNSASGYKCDSVYLSEDRMWDIEDSQVGEPSCQSFSLAANQTEQLHFSLRYKIPHVTARYYSTLVKSRTNVIDIHIDNNVGVSKNKTRVAYQSVTTRTSTSMKLLADQFLSVQIINVSADETLVVNVTSNKVNAFNNIFLKSNSPATLYDFEIASDNPNLPNQIVSVPNTLSTDYYILVENSGFLTQKVEQNVTISVKYATFEIIDVFPKSAITGAQTTLYIKGTLFPYDMQARLNSSNDVFTAKSIYVFSSTESYVSFDIPLNIPESNFSLFLSSASLNQTIVFNGEISVGSGTNGFLFTNVETTARIRTGETGTVKLEIQNRGDSDLLVPIIKVEAFGDGSLRLMDETFDGFYRNRFYLFGSPEQGPAGLLRPNARSLLTFKSQQKDLVFQRSEVKTMKLSVYEIVQSIDTPNPFLEMKEDMRPSHYNAEQWMPVWNNFITMTGNNTLSLASKMSAVLTEMSLAGRYVWKVDSILKYLVDFADAPYGDRTLQIETDFDIQSDANVRLVIDRFLSARIGSRKQPGYIGPGWILPLWDTRIKAIDESELTFTLEKEDYVFVKVDDNIYIHKKLGAITETGTEFVLRRYQDNKEFHFDSETLTLRSILSLTDSSSLHFEYEKSLLTKIRHSEGPYVLVKYNTKHLIQSMELLNTTSPETITKVLYVYDFDTGMLSQTRSDSGTTRYHYKDAALSYVMYGDGSMFFFNYNDLGHLKTRNYLVKNKEVSVQEYGYSNGGMISVHSKLDNNKYRLTFSEEGEIIQIIRDGFLPDKTVFTGTTETNYEGDLMVNRRLFENDGKQLIVEDGNGDKIKTIFNEKYQLTTFVDGQGNQYDIAINENGTLRNVKYPDGTNKTYRYIQNGHIKTTQSGATKRYEYNDRKQLLMKDIGNNSITTYAYDETGNLIRAVNENGEIEIAYRDTKVASVKYPGNTIHYQYDENKQVTRITTSNGYNVTYKYNEHGQLQKIIDKEDNVLLEAEYNSMGKITKRLLGNNASTEYEYDTVTGLLKVLRNFYPNGTLASFFNYTYSTRMRRIAVDTLEGTWKFKYDRAGQVISMTDPKGNVTEYEYDNAKNRKIISINGVDAQSTINEMNQYIKYRDMVFKYDKNGNLVQRNGSIQEKFVFDEENRIVAYKSNTDQCDFKYDTLGNLYMKTCNGRSARFVINPAGNYDMDILEQINTRAGKETAVHYYHGGDQIGLVAAKHDDLTLNYFMYDPLGSVTNILDEAGNLLNSYQRNPFGEVLSATETVESMFSFVGQWGVIDLQGMTGIYFMRLRLYDSYTGRFMSIDPLGLKAQSRNFYAYCSNNPVHFNDPRGTCPWCIVALEGAVEGSLESLFDYVRSNKEWTWGGAAGAVIEGGLNGAVQKWVPKWAQPLVGGGIHVLGSWAQHAIDGEPYSFKDAFTDFSSYVVNENSLVKKVKSIDKTIDKVCSLLEKYIDFIQKTCDVKRQLDREVRKIADGVTQWVRSMDPNDISGPTGYGRARFIQKDHRMEYKIRFENNENATAPAQRVYIEHKYSEHLDARTFIMGDFGFGNFKKEFPPKSKLFQGTIDMTAELGLVIRAFAGLDLEKNMVIWEFQSLDPKTGDAPTDPSIGFLPPNNGTSGQGYVTFSMKPNKDVAHLSTVHANASIYFDQNEPIDTPNIFNTIDDSSPEVNGSVISGTESTDSVTLSVLATDTGSGVKHVDIFELQGNSLSLLQGGVTENIFLVKLKLGESKRLLPVAVDQVGNRPNLTEIEKESAINVTSTVQSGTCDCSGHGNCSARMQVCLCDEGFYGPSCNSTSPPPEPPLLELKSKAGFTNEPVELTISARNLSGCLDEIQIFLSGMPDGTSFSKGIVQNDSTILLLSTDFGQLNMTTNSTGEHSLKILVTQFTNGTNFTRSGELQIMIYPKIENASFEFDGCFSEDSKGEIVARLNSSVILSSEQQTFLNNESTSIPHSVTLTVPTWARPLETFKSGSVYRIEDTVKGYFLKLNGRFEPFNVTVDVKIEPDGVPSAAYSKQFEVSRFCYGECREHDYGVKCNYTCDCDWDNTVECNKFNGSCSCLRQWKGMACDEFACPCVVNNTEECEPENQTCECKGGWKGKGCDIDIDECLNNTICDAHNNTGCQNRDWGYDCLCLIGYQLENDTCIEEIDMVNTTMLTENPEEKITTVSLHLNIQVPNTVNLKVAVTYEIYKKKSSEMLEIYYAEKLGDNFIKVIINSISKGSLIIDHTVITRKTEEGAQVLAMAVAEMMTDNSSLTFDGQPVNVSDITLDNTTVTNNLCDVYTRINPCGLTKCVTDNGKPACRSLEPPAETNKSRKILVIPLAVGIPVVFLIVVVTVWLCVRKKKNKKENSYEDTSPKSESHGHADLQSGLSGKYRRKHSSSQFQNPVYGSQLSGQESAWQSNPYYTKGGPEKSGSSYNKKHNAYVYQGRHK